MPEGPPTRYSEDGRWWWNGQEWLPVSITSTRPRRRSHVWLAISGALLVLLVAATLLYELIVAAGGWRAELLPVKPNTQSNLRNLRVCTAANFDLQNSVCKRNQASSELQTDRLLCSADVIGNIGQQLTVRVLYQSHQILHFDKIIHGSKLSGFSAITLAPGKPLPGGDWSCEFSVSGQSAMIHARLNGPSGSLLYASACEANEVVSVSGLQSCSQDRDIITRPNALACTAIVRGAENRDVEVDLAYSGGERQAFTRAAKGIANLYIFPAGLTLQAADVGSLALMPVGHYTCRWLVAGQEIGMKEFQVSA